jgi:5-oxopent-3-ene-1,2,5-tricarboxylate decarboxylase/2-hydroxyhepta-2,4-diene-1,7-dioate isomerase
MKPITGLNGHRGELVRPEGCQFLNYEGEVAVVIGRVTRNIEAEQAWDHILGFAPANDAGLHDLRETDAGSMFRTKGADTLCPIGPGIVSGIDIREETLRTFRNGVLVQETPVAEMVYGIDYLIADIARYITLLPGDVILSGTPANSRPLDIGDLIEVEVTSVGRLSNRVVAAPAPLSSCGFQPFDGPETQRVALGVDDRLSESLKGSTARARSARGASYVS